jgi:hypothetical protein
VIARRACKQIAAGVALPAGAGASAPSPSEETAVGAA